MVDTGFTANPTVESSELIRWNSDKRYLADVAAKGLPVVPTAVIDRNELMSQRQLAEIGSDIVVKPSVGAGSHGVRRFTEQHEAALNYLRALIESGETPLIQPYLTNIDTRGEVGLVTAAGVLSHSFHKEAILNGDVQWSSDGHVLEVISAHTPSESELALCNRVLALLPETADARFDMLPTDDGPVISEIELIEPSLFLEVDTGAVSDRSGLRLTGSSIASTPCKWTPASAFFTSFVHQLRKLIALR